MILSPVAGVATIVPVLMLVGGMAILVVGLVLLTGQGDRSGSARTRAGTPTWGPAVATPRPPPAHDTAPTCDWSAWLETADGQRLLLRRAHGRACCHYVVGVRELDPVIGPLDELEESLCWAGTATQIGPNGATTSTERDMVTRRATTQAGHLHAGISLDRAPGPVVTTPGWRETPGSDEAAAVAPDSRPAQLWTRHIDDLRDHGARPAPTDGPRVAPLQLRRRIEVSVRVERGCTPAAHPATVRARVRAQLSGAATAGTGRLAAPSLASWVAIGDVVVATADTPTVPPSGLASWEPRARSTGTGVQAVADRSTGTCEAEWDGQWQGEFDESAVTLTVGSDLHLELDTSADAGQPVAAELYATLAAFVHLGIEEAPAEGASGCTRCVPRFELFLGRDGVRDVRATAPGSTAEGAIRLDGRVLRLCPPAPGGGQRSWTVVREDLDEHAWQSNDVHEVG